MKTKIRLMLILCLGLMAQFTFAQEIEVSGTVEDEDGTPLPGVNVAIEETDEGTQTDFDGNYSIEAEKGTTLVFTYVGMKDHTVTVGDETTVNITLQEGNELKEVVVTGGVNPKENVKSATAVSTFSASNLVDLAPKGTADLLQNVPGMAVENSGGEVGNNVFSRGIPSAGSYEYVQLQEDGMPIFEDGALQFANADIFSRIDGTIAKTEALRGGSGSVFASNAPGGIINFISKEGSNTFRGMSKLETGSYGNLKYEGNFSGALVKDKLFFNIGGFYRVDNGVRSPGYRANNGGQVKMNLKYQFDKGHIKAYFKNLNDRNLFYLPIPLLQEGSSIKEFPGFDAHHGTYASMDMTNLKVPQVGGGFFERDLENGIHPKMNVVGAEFEYEIADNLSFNNKARYTDIDLEYSAIYPTGIPETADNFAHNYTTQGGEEMPITGDNYEYSYVDGGEIANPEYVQKVGLWAIDKDMHNFANDLRFQYDIDDLVLSLGFYKSDWKSSHYWNWNNLLTEAKDHGRLLNLVDKSLNPNSDNYSRTYNGVSDITWMERNSSIHGSVNALYLNGDWDANDKWNFSGGIRYENNTYRGTNDNTSTGDDINLDRTDLAASGEAYNGKNGFNTTTADNSIMVSSGPYENWKYNVEELSGTFAVDYLFNDDNATFFRYSHGFRSPIEEAFYDNADDLSSIKPTKTNQFELGFKHHDQIFDLTAIAFISNLDNIAFTDILADGSSENAFGGSSDYGLELEGNLHLFNRVLNIAFSGTVQNPELRDMEEDGESLKGNTVQRIPKIFFNVRPMVNITNDWNAYFSVYHYGKTFGDNLNTQELPAFTEVGAGMAYQWGKFRLAVDATNIFNEIGLTEGDPRSLGESGEGIIMARPILGAAVTTSVSVNF